jgi:hypothetical protein
MLKPNQLQSLIARNSRDIASVYREIHATAAMLSPYKDHYELVDGSHSLYYKVTPDEYNKPFYAILSKLQSKRKQLEDLQRSLKRELRSAQRVVRAAKIVAAAGIDKMLVADLSHQTYVNENGKMF